MRTRAIPILLAIAGTAIAPASASAARYTVGIGDQSAALFSQPAFASTGVNRVRYLVPWDWNRIPGIRAEVAGYVDTATAHGKDVFVTFTAKRGCWANNRYSRSGPCRAPSASSYRASLRAFRSRFPAVRTFAPWNEANHMSQPTAHSPRKAASYWNVLRRDCRGCRLVAADVLDQTGVTGYLRAFRRYAKGSPRRWGLHNYSDVNRRRSSGTRAVLRTVPGEVWLTETGGVVKFGRSFPYSESRAAARTRFMFTLADTYSRRRSGLRSRITRIYPYAWFGERRGARFDAGLVSHDGRPRAALSVFRAYAKKRNG
jgi:hypothetical protein